MKVINDLLNYKNMKIVQDEDYFNFSLYSVLLPNFVTLNSRINRILDLGTGNAQYLWSYQQELMYQYME